MLSLSLPPSVLADPDKAAYELQERCGRRANEWFKETNGTGITNTKDAQLFSNFRNHYSARLNKCFVLVMSTAVNHKKTGDGKVSSTTMETLFDLNDNNEYGEFNQVDLQVLSCYVQDNHCSNKNEWEMLIKPYLDQ